MYVVRVGNNIVYAATDESKFREVVAKKYARVVNARLDFVRPAPSTNSIKLQQEPQNALR